MIKKRLVLYVFAIIVLGCSVKEPPEFLGIQNIKVLESTKTFITISGEGLFKNPNDIGVELKADGI